MWYSQHHQDQADVDSARGLGWFSLAIGLSELLAPRKLQELLGLDQSRKHDGILKTLGVREVLHGLAILSEKRPTQRLATSVWSRVAGDALDTALLAAAAKQTKAPKRFAVVSAAILGIGLLDAVYATRTSRAARRWW
ncbi:MAG: hypothetical protein QM770_09915 [Tepidisphaeraceae bacterium]